MTETKRLCEFESRTFGTRITTHLVDVANEAQVLCFRDEVAAQHDTRCIHLLINNAGIAGGGSLVKSSREEWDRTFGICWNGVYFNIRAFLPMLLEADAGHLVNLSSAAGFWAAAGARMPHTAYSAAKFAVKGFTEALIVDFRENAPHLRCSVVMPGHVGTELTANTRRTLHGDEKDLPSRRAELRARGYDTAAMTDAEIETICDELEDDYVARAPLAAADAAAIIIAGVKSDSWRILVGDDAKHLDESVRRNPGQAYDADFFDRFVGRMKSPTRRLRRLLAGLKRRLGEHSPWRSGHPRRA
jgi:NAD(P)-dependent dehydrogenase (short-subunit alcohol dehydrogenase family)